MKHDLDLYFHIKNLAKTRSFIPRILLFYDNWSSQESIIYMSEKILIQKK